MSKLRPHSGDPTLAIAYLRVSTEQQDLGPEAQRAAIERWAEANKIRVVSWHVDHGVSGATEPADRPGLMAALAAIEDSGAGILVAAKRDRIARDVVIAATIERLASRIGAKVQTADGIGAGDGPEATLLKGIIDAIGQYERALIRSRTKAALAVKKARGELVGNVPIGYRLGRDGRTLEPDPGESKAVERILSLRALGMPCAKIAATLTAEGIPARSGRWHPNQIRRVAERQEGR
ncbi:MAG: recombinase family protein [Patescibacteria group bacterium]|nr:recombinase family protein [Patescibacteria group bacterium]